MSLKKNLVTRFLSDVCEHRMAVLQDNGLYRHLRFQRPGTSSYYFDIVTWPGYLTVTGDMGTWTFSRINDMFDFFGGDFAKGINTGYWSEKIEAGTSCNRDLICKEYDHDQFCKDLLRWQKDYLDENEDGEQEEDTDWDDDNHEDTDEARIREIVRNLTRSHYGNEHEAYSAVYEADWPECLSAWDICDGITFKSYTFHFLWILHAIVWGIGKYHNTKLVDRAMSVYLSFSNIRPGAGQ